MNQLLNYKIILNGFKEFKIFTQIDPFAAIIKCREEFFKLDSGLAIIGALYGDLLSLCFACLKTHLKHLDFCSLSEKFVSSYF